MISTTPGGQQGSDQDAARERLAASVASVSLQVTSANVLAVRDTLLDKAAELEAGLVLHWTAATTMPRLAGDPISADAAVAFPERTHTLLAQCQQYVRDLRAAAHALDDTARGYGLAEGDIENTMHAVALTADQQAGQPALTMDQILNPHLYGTA